MYWVTKEIHNWLSQMKDHLKCFISWEAFQMTLVSGLNVFVKYITRYGSWSHLLIYSKISQFPTTLWRWSSLINSIYIWECREFNGIVKFSWIAQVLVHWSSLLPYSSNLVIMRLQSIFYVLFKQPEQRIL